MPERPSDIIVDLFDNYASCMRCRRTARHSRIHFPNNKFGCTSSSRTSRSLGDRNRSGPSSPTSRPTRGGIHSSAMSTAWHKRADCSKCAFTRPVQGMTSFRPRVLVADAPRELRWRAYLLRTEHPGGVIIDSCSSHWPTATCGSCRSRLFQRPPDSAVARCIDRNISRGFREMNAALKGRVERGAA